MKTSPRTRRMTLLALTSLAAWLSAAPAVAGRRPFIWTWDTETLAKGDTEIEQWLWVKNKWKGGAPMAPGGGWLWISPVYGLYEHVEIAFPWEAVVVPGAGTQITNFTTELRIPFFDRNKEKAIVRPLLRVFGQWNFNHPENKGLGKEPSWVGGNAVLSIGNPAGSHATIDVGGYGDTAGAPCKLGYQTVAAGYAHRVNDEIRVGVEYFQERWRGKGCAGGYSGPQREHHYFAGPDIAFSRGRVWATIGVLYGRVWTLGDKPGWDDTVRILMPRFIFSTII